MSKNAASKASQTASSLDQNPQSPEKKCSPWLLFALPIGLGLALSVVITLVNVLRTVDTKAIYLGLDGLRSLIFGTLIVTIAMCCILLRLKPKLRTILASLACCVIVGFVFSKLVRVESFYGNMVPRLTWSWKPTPEQAVREYFVNRRIDPTESLAERHELDKASLFQPSESDFPGFLGPGRNAVLVGVKLDADWTARPPCQLWRHPVGLGWSSFAVVGGAAVNLEQRGESECVVCYELHSGRELWSHAEKTRFVDEHGDGPRSTPTVVGGRVYSLGATGILTCLNFQTGELIWRQQVLDSRQQNLLWGMSGSPLVIDDRVIVTPGGQAAAAICYSASDGRKLWQVGDDPGAYASPMATEICGQQQILSFNGAGLRAITTKGELQWLFPWLTQGELQRVNVAQPVVVDTLESSPNSVQRTRILISSGYGNGTALIQVESRDGQWNAETVWHSRQLKSKMSNFVVHGDYIYGLDSGILTCIDLAGGTRQWKGGRYGHGQILLVDDLLLIQAEAGEVVLVRASPDGLHQLASLPALDGKTWNHAALAGNILLVRNDHEAAAYELPVLPNRNVQ